MFPLKLFLIVTLTFCLIFNYVQCDCVIDIGNPRPMLWKFFGLRRIIIPNSLNRISLIGNDAIYVECPTSIQVVNENVQDIPNKKSIKLYNIDGNCYYNYDDGYEGKYLRNDYDITVRCKEHGSNLLYESLAPLPNCLAYDSYGIGEATTTNEQMISFKTCFDFTSRKAVYVSYIIEADEEFIDLSKKLSKINYSSFSLNREVNGIDIFWETLSKTEFNEKFEKIRSSNIALRLFHFDYQGIIQDNQIRERLGEYEKMFMTIWWRNLREGIWEMYSNAMREQSKMGTYEIYAGTSEDLIVPTNDCKKEDTLSMIINGASFNAPRYIWNLVIPKSYPTSDKPFVVIGYNSPFENQLNETKFCKDMCSEIDWLNTEINFLKSHHFNSIGILHCCDPKDVMSKLDGFPSSETELERLTKPEVEKDASNLYESSGMQSSDEFVTSTEDYN